MTGLRTWVVVAVLALGGGPAGAGVLTITKCKMADKTNGGEVTTGYADAALPVDFKGDANCTCEAPAITYTWAFGDGTTAQGKNVSHTYGAAGAGERTAGLTCNCTNCNSNAAVSPLSLHVISGIQVTKIGDTPNPNGNGKLCFDAKRAVEGKALPAGVLGSTLIDWLIPYYPSQLANAAAGTMPSPPNPWPATNAAWGTQYFSINIDGPNIPGQEGELNLTGPVSYVHANQDVKVFFDLLGSQNPSTATPKPKNWFFYWTQTSANKGTMNYSAGATSYCDFNNAPTYPCYLTDGDSGTYTR